MFLPIFIARNLSIINNNLKSSPYLKTYNLFSVKTKLYVGTIEELCVICISSYYLIL